MSNDSNGPYVAFAIITQFQNFWGDVIRRAYLLSQISLIEPACGFEIDDFNLIDPLCIFNENVFGFNVSVNNFVIVEIVDTAQYLPDNNSCVLFNKLAPLLHLVKEVTAETMSNNQIQALFILVVLVKLDNVGMVLQFETRNLLTAVKCPFLMPSSSANPHLR